MPTAEIAQEPSDEELVARTLGGEPAAFRTVIQRYNQRLYRAARAIVRDELEAEDVVQAAYLHAYAHLGQLEGRAQLGGWLLKIAVNEALARTRERKRTHPLEEVVLEAEMATRRPMTQPGPEEELLGKELATLLERSVDELPEPLRVVFVLRVVEGLSTGEAALALELSEENVRVRLHRAREALQRVVYASTEPAAPRAFQFLGHRCETLTERVLARLGIASDLARP